MEIKFRGLRTDGKGWVYGDLLTHPEIGTTIFIHSEPLYQHGGVYLGTEVIPKTAGQFTGLHDKNGKEIYSGDLIKDCITGAILQVMFGHNKNSGYNGWYCKYVNIDAKDTSLNGDYDTDINNNIEVIGNIFERPELFK